jgi:hypothetical protein
VLIYPGSRLIEAPELEPSSEREVFFFREKGEKTVKPLDQLRTFFLDPDLSITKYLKSFIAQLRQRHVGFNRFGDDAALCLNISGAPKTGKTLIIRKVIPALLRDDEMFGVGRAAEARVWHLDTTDFDRRNGCTGFLCSLLDALISLAAKDGIQEVSHFKMGARAYSTVTAELKSFISQLPRHRPTFILLDEVQNFFLLEKEVMGADGVMRRVLDEGEIIQMRRVFKPLIGSSPLHCIWVITGSRMALYWANIASCPVNGYSLLTHIPTLRLPTSVPTAVKQQAWNVLCSEYTSSDFPRQLLEMSPQHHAALVFFCVEWLRMGCPQDAADFCVKTFKSKICPEIVEDYRVVLESLSSEKRRTMLDMLSIQGVAVDKIPLGVLAYLENDLVNVGANGQNRTLNSPLVSCAIQALLDGDGELVKDLDSSATMLSYCDTDLLRTFGALLAKRSPAADTRALLEGMAASVQPTFWQSPWFAEVLQDNLQQPQPRIAKAYQTAIEGGLLQPWEHMSFYLRLWSNCVRHGDEKQLGLASKFVQSVPSALWMFAKDGKVQHAISELQTPPTDAENY